MDHTPDLWRVAFAPKEQTHVHEVPQVEGVRLEEVVADCYHDSIHQNVNLMRPNG